MMGRYGRGSLMSVPPEQRRTMLADAVVESDGKLLKAAHLLGYHRSHIYRLIDMYRLWPVVNNVRRRRIARQRRK